MIEKPSQESPPKEQSSIYPNPYKKDFYDLTLLHGSLDKEKYREKESELLKEYFNKYFFKLNETRGFKETPSWKKLFITYAKSSDEINDLNNVIKVTKKGTPIPSFVEYVELNGNEDLKTAIKKNERHNDIMLSSLNTIRFWLDVLEDVLSSMFPKTKNEEENKENKACKKLFKSLLEKQYEEYDSGLGYTDQDNKVNPFNLVFTDTLKCLILVNFKIIISMYVCLNMNIDELIKFFKAKNNSIPFPNCTLAKQNNASNDSVTLDKSNKHNVSSASSKNKVSFSIYFNEDCLDFIVHSLKPDNLKKLSYTNKDKPFHTSKGKFQNLKKDFPTLKAVNNKLNSLGPGDGDYKTALLNLKKDFECGRSKPESSYYLNSIYKLSLSPFFTSFNCAWIRNPEKSHLVKKMKRKDIFDAFCSKKDLNLNGFFISFGDKISGLLERKSTIYKWEDEYSKNRPPLLLENIRKLAERKLLFLDMTPKFKGSFSFRKEYKDSLLVHNFFSNLSNDIKNGLHNSQGEILNEVIPKKELQKIKKSLKKDNLDDIQIQSVIAALSKPGFMFGSAGTGKTTCIMNVIEGYVNAGIQPYVLSPTGKAANVLQDKWKNKVKNSKNENLISGLTAPKISTIHRFSFSRKQDPASKVILIDEVSMVSMDIFRKLIIKLKSDKSLLNVVMFGDVKQLPPIERGEFVYSYYNQAKLHKSSEIGGLNISELKNVYRQTNSKGTAENKLMPLITLFQEKGGKGKINNDVINIIKEYSEYKDTIEKNTSGLNYGRSGLLFLTKEKNDRIKRILDPILKKEAETILNYFKWIKNKNKDEKKHKENIDRILTEWSFISPTNKDVNEINDLVLDKVNENSALKEDNHDTVYITFPSKKEKLKFFRKNKISFNLDPIKKYSKELSVGSKIRYSGNNIYDDSFDEGFSKVKFNCANDIEIEEAPTSPREIKIAKNESFIVTDIFQRNNKEKVLIIESKNNIRVLCQGFKENKFEIKPTEKNDDGKKKEIKYSLGYCQTVHSSQGSEYERCYVIISPKGKIAPWSSEEAFFSLNLLYTASSRAQKQALMLFLSDKGPDEASSLFKQMLQYNCSNRSSPLNHILSNYEQDNSQKQKNSKPKEKPQTKNKKKTKNNDLNNNTKDNNILQVNNKTKEKPKTNNKKKTKNNDLNNNTKDNNILHNNSENTQEINKKPKKRKFWRLFKSKT